MHWLKTRILKSTTLWILSAAAVVVGSSIAQNAFDNNPAQTLIERLTDKPSETWLDSGTVKVMHTAHKAPAITDPEEIEQRTQQAIQAYQNNPNKPQRTPERQAQWLEAIPFNMRYDYANESTTVTQEEIRFDRQLFYCEITILSHTDSVRPEPELASNTYIAAIDLEHNRNRIFTYDGQRFTHYFESAHQALVKEGQSAPDMPRALSAGIMPWGYGPYTRSNLLKSQPTTSNEVINGTSYTRLSLTLDNGIHVEIVLDPDTLAMYRRTFTWANGVILDAELSKHVQVNGRWIPTEIYEEQLAPEEDGYRLISWEMWQLDIVNTDAPRFDEYSPDFKEEDVIHYRSPISKSDQRYYYHNGADTETLLTKRLNALAMQKSNGSTANCATLAMREAGERLGRPITESLDTLVDKTGATSLGTMQQFLRDQGFFCRAVQTTVQKLMDYSDKYEAILHLPKNNHYVLFDSMDNDKVWTVDLSDHTFYRSTPLNRFAQQWTDGIALLISTAPIQSQGGLVALSETQLTDIAGAGWSCTLLLQDEYTFWTCSPGPPCNGYVWQFFKLWGCESAPSGNCTETYDWIEWARSPCKLSPYGSCVISYIGTYVELAWGCSGELF